jgi:ubiquinone/menaquinone biosynthesis C-methylase UbiE
MGKIIDKKKILDSLTISSSLIIELGCGATKINSESIAIDAIDYPEVDIVGDIYEVLKKFPDSSVTHVSSVHFIEHISDINLLMIELERVIKPGGVIDFTAPHFSNPYFFSDYTHRNFFGLYTFCYLSNSNIFSRKVPIYKKNLVFNLVSVDLIFKSPKPFYGRYAFKSIIGFLFNSSIYMKELYEENFCYLFPCYEIRYQLRKEEDVDL